MKIIHISDTHGCHRRLTDLPGADVVVHSGDFTMNGSEEEVLDFLNWFCGLPYDYKIFICGNHDDCLYGANIEGLDPNVHYLPRLHLFGHIHAQHGTVTEHGITFSNGAIMNAGYTTLNIPNILEI